MHASKDHFLCVPESRNRVASDSSVVMRGGGEGLQSPQSRVSLSFTFSVRSFCVSSFSSGYGDMMLRHFPSKSVCMYRSRSFRSWSMYFFLPRGFIDFSSWKGGVIVNCVYTVYIVHWGCRISWVLFFFSFWELQVIRRVYALTFLVDMNYFFGSWW